MDGILSIELAAEKQFVIHLMPTAERNDRKALGILKAPETQDRLGHCISVMSQNVANGAPIFRFSSVLKCSKKRKLKL